jgi:hypothetical protein
MPRQTDAERARAFARAEAAWLEPPDDPEVDDDGHTDCGRRGTARCGRCDRCQIADEIRADEAYDRMSDDREDY